MSYEGEARATPITKGLGLLTYLVLLCSVPPSELRARQDLVAGLGAQQRRQYRDDRTLTSTPNTTFTIEFFASSTCDPSRAGAAPIGGYHSRGPDSPGTGPVVCVAGDSGFARFARASGGKACNGWKFWSITEAATPKVKTA